jgi:phenylpropionate dioxygenase-like ring-hydroxylating dioxygenase large terminal subunit
MSIHEADLKALIRQQRPGWSLAQPFYVDPAIYEHERRGLLSRQWLLMGHASELPQVGSYIVREALNESLLIIRGKDVRIRAFYNVCTHRGSRLCETDGHARGIVCPYHAWSFTLEGTLRHVPGLPEDADPATLGLRPVRTHVIEGLILCSFSDEAWDLGAAETEMRSVLQQHGFAGARIAARRSYPTRANWKLVMPRQGRSGHLDQRRRRVAGANGCLACGDAQQRRVRPRGRQDDCHRL